MHRYVIYTNAVLPIQTKSYLSILPRGTGAVKQTIQIQRCGGIAHRIKYALKEKFKSSH
jgi:hypothetical protein